nr:hypothetical protein Iba_chr04aCG5860 [Ipomoea batatas]
MGCCGDDCECHPLGFLLGLPIPSPSSPSSSPSSASSSGSSG